MSLSRRYAKALLEISERTESVSKTAAGLDELVQTLRGSRELDDTIKNPMFPREQRRAILQRVCEAMALPEHLTIFLGFLFDRDRLALIPDLARVFRRLADERTGELRGEVVSASPLESAQLEALRVALSGATQRNVTLSAREDAALLGGAVARVGDVIFDGSVRAQLAKMKASLLGD